MRSWVVPELGHERLREITLPQVQRFVYRLAAEGLAANTIAQIEAMLAGLEHAKDRVKGSCADTDASPMRFKRDCTRTRGLLICWAAVVALVSAAPAAASIPPKQERVDAKRFARAWWASRNWNYGDGVANCSGVRFRWNSWHYDPNIRRSLAYVPFPSDCTIVFNAEANWARVPESGPGETTFLGDGWWRLCATAIHEWGHLRGMPYSLRNPPIHSWNRNIIMAVAEKLNTNAWWWPYFPGCRYEGDGVDYDE